ncbi:MAG: hypothetical protein AAGN82_30945, partial [Myxococcota bacterium]
FTSFDRVYGSPGGTWAITGVTDALSAVDEVLIVNGIVEVQEGSPAAWAPGENVGAIDRVLGVNDGGTFAFTTNTDGPTSSDEYVVLGQAGGMLMAVAREGDTSAVLPANATWGDLLQTPTVTAAGDVGFVVKNVGGVPTAEDEFVILGSTVLAQKGVTVPQGQIGAETWQLFDSEDFWVTPDGLHHLLQGDLTGATATDDIVVVDGSVIVQEGVVLAGSGFVEPVDQNGIIGVHLAADGTYFVRGRNASTSVDWVYSNGAVLATLGQAVIVGATEAWSDTEFAAGFFLHVGNGLGDFVIGGVSDGPTASNGLLAFNNTNVVAREGDPVDVDQNGFFDDDAFISTFGNDDAFLADNGLFYFVASLEDGNGNDIGDGFFVVDTSTL